MADPFTPAMFGADRFEDCPEARRHPRQPDEYIERSNWTERQAKRYTQTRCPACGFWVLWKRKERT